MFGIDLPDEKFQFVSIRKVFLSGCWNYQFSLRKRGVFSFGKEINQL